MTSHEGAAYHSNCRCDHCRTGKAAYWRARQAAVKSGSAEASAHGTGGYRQGCRCDVCRTATRVQRQLERAERRGEPPPQTAEVVVELYRRGHSLETIAARLRRSPGWVSRRLRENNVAIRQPGITSATPTDLIVALYQQGLSAASVGERVNLSQTAVTKRLTQAGVNRSRAEANRLRAPAMSPRNKKIDIAQAKQMRAEGRTQDEIAVAFGVTQSAVSHALRRAGIRVRGRRGDAGRVRKRPAVSAGSREDAQGGKGLVERYLAGERIAALARDYSVSDTTIRTWLTAAGVALPKKRAIDAAEAIALYQAGDSLDRVAEKMGVSDMSIHRLLVKYGIPRRPQGWPGSQPTTQ